MTKTSAVPAATAASDRGLIRFDFQTHSWHANTRVHSSPLGHLPGRPCPIAAALEVVGERWALLVVREIALGATRFTDIVAGTGAPRDRIAARLKTLDEAGVIERRPYQSAPPRFEYHLTESGRALLPVLDALLGLGQGLRRRPRRPRPATPLPTPSPTSTRRPVTAELTRDPTDEAWGEPSAPHGHAGTTPPPSTAQRAWRWPASTTCTR